MTPSFSAAVPHVFVYLSQDGKEISATHCSSCPLARAVDRVLLEGGAGEEGSGSDSSNNISETSMRVAVRSPGIQAHVAVPVKFKLRRDRRGAMYVDVGENSPATEIGQASVVGFVKAVTSTRDVFGYRKILVVENVHLLARVPMLGLKRIVETAARTSWIVFSSRSAGCLDPALASRFRHVNAAAAAETCRLSLFPPPLPSPLLLPPTSNRDDEEGLSDLSGEGAAKQLTNRIRRLRNDRHLMGVRVNRQCLETDGGVARLFRSVLSVLARDETTRKEDLADLARNLSAVEHRFALIKRSGVHFGSFDPHLLMCEAVYAIKRAVT